jgi:hypothetical protein
LISTNPIVVKVDYFYLSMLGFQFKDASHFKLDDTDWQSQIKLIFSVYENAGQITINSQIFPVTSDPSGVISYLSKIKDEPYFADLVINYVGDSLMRTQNNIPPIQLDHIPNLNQPQLFAEALLTLKKCLKCPTHIDMTFELGLDANQIISFIKDLWQANLAEFRVTRYCQIDCGLNESIFQVVINEQLITIQGSDFIKNCYWQFDIDEGYYHIAGLEVPIGLHNQYQEWRSKNNEKSVKLIDVLTSIKLIDVPLGV